MSQSLPHLHPHQAQDVAQSQRELKRRDKAAAKVLQNVWLWHAQVCFTKDLSGGWLLWGRWKWKLTECSGQCLLPAMGSPGADRLPDPM